MLSEVACNALAIQNNTMEDNAENDNKKNHKQTRQIKNNRNTYNNKKETEMLVDSLLTAREEKFQK